MASTKKKLDDKHVKTLRDLAALPANKYCFDCQQRGPTYVNITIGSFVCTKCSGILRGLTPPHRVKSISMATFTPEEVDFLKSKGNQYCQSVWLGLCESEPTTKDELQIKEFMIDKYEKKRYYMDPKKSSVERPVNGISSSQSTPANLDLAFAPPLPKKETSRTTLDNKQNEKYLADPFLSPASDEARRESTSFANFDNNPIFSQLPAPVTAPSVPGGNIVLGGSLPTLAGSASINSNLPPNNVPPAPSEDRYAALKDLDSLMKCQKQPIPSAAETSNGHSTTASTSSDPWGETSSSSETSPWSMTTQSFSQNGSASQRFNPFASQISANNDNWGFFNANTTPSVNNPFKDLKQTDWFSNSNSGLTSSQSVGSFQWSTNPSVPNPFTSVGVRPTNGGGAVGGGLQSSNPFI